MRALRGLVSFVRALARELSDESAYARHLEMAGRAHSAEEWKRFIDSRHRRKYQNGKCC
jgi:hypothetical protein